MCNPEKEENGGSEQKLGDITSAENQPDGKKGRLVTQVAACMAASLGTLSSGAVNGWTANTLTSMQEDPAIHMGTAEMAWMAGIIGVAALVGSPLAGHAMDRLGRRMTIMSVCPLMVAGWLLMALGPYLSVVLAGRAICGLMTAFLFSSVSVYNSEVPETRVRGMLGTMSSFFITLGIVLSYTAGAFLSWRYSCYVCAAPAALAFLALLAMPESPYWLMLKGRRSDAEAALRWLRGPHYDIMEDLESIDAKLKAVGTKLQYRELLRPRTRRPFFIALFTMTMQQASGANILMMYTGSIFLSAGVEDHHMATVYTGLIQLVGTIASVLLMDKLGRRCMIVVSLSTVGVFTALLGVYYYLRTEAGVMWPLWVPLVTVLVSVLGYCFGCRTIPWLTSSELFNTTIRSTANAVCFFYNRVLNFAIIQIYPFVADAVGTHNVFFFFGGVCLVGSVLSTVVLPETKGKSLEQIQEYFERKTLKASGRKSGKKDAPAAEGKKTCSKGGESLFPSVDLVISPVAEELTMMTEKENMMTKL